MSPASARQEFTPHRVIRIATPGKSFPTTFLAKFVTKCPISFATAAFFADEQLAVDNFAPFPSATVFIYGVSSNTVAPEQIFQLHSSCDRAVLQLGSQVYRKLFPGDFDSESDSPKATSVKATLCHDCINFNYAII